MNEYIHAVKDAVKDLTGEVGLGCQIASNVRDCLTLDRIHRIQSTEAVEEVVRLIQSKDSIHNARVSQAGLCQCLKLSLLEQGSDSFSTMFIGAGGMELVLSVMSRHAAVAEIQQTGAELITVALDPAVPSIVEPYLETAHIANALVEAMRRHADKVRVQEVVINAIVHIEQLDLKDQVQTFVVTAGSIPLLFRAVQRYPANIDVCGGALHIILSMCSSTTGSSHQKLCIYAAAHPEWFDIVRHSCASSEMIFRLFVAMEAVDLLGLGGERRLFGTFDDDDDADDNPWVW